MNRKPNKTNTSSRNQNDTVNDIYKKEAHNLIISAIIFFVFLVALSISITFIVYVPDEMFKIIILSAVLVFCLALTIRVQFVEHKVRKIRGQ